MNADRITSEETTFLQGIATSPEDAQLMLVYADWLEERGDQRGKLLRLIAEMNAIKINSDEYRKLAKRRDNLVERCNNDWSRSMIRAALLARISALLNANRPDYYAGLQPGATDDQLDAFERRFSLTLPPSFRQLYRWRNGQDVEYTPIEFNRTFSTLEDIARTKEICDSMIEADFEDPEWWRRGWVPFLHMAAGVISASMFSRRMVANQASSLNSGKRTRTDPLYFRAWTYGWSTWHLRWRMARWNWLNNRCVAQSTLSQ